MEMDGTFLGRLGPDVRQLVAKLFEPVRLVTLVICQITTRRTLATYWTVVTLFHGPIGLDVLQLVSLEPKSELTDGLVLTKIKFKKRELAKLETDFTPTGHHGESAHKHA